jgi:hypothetical protein
MTIYIWWLWIRESYGVNHEKNVDEDIRASSLVRAVVKEEEEEEEECALRLRGTNKRGNVYFEST